MLLPGNGSPVCKNVVFRTGDYSWVNLGGPYDLICSALSIHHLDPDDKHRLFGRIFSVLAPGGVFVNADQADGETPYFTGEYREDRTIFYTAGRWTPRSLRRSAGAGTRWTKTRNFQCSFRGCTRPVFPMWMSCTKTGILSLRLHEKDGLRPMCLQKKDLGLPDDPGRFWW